MGLARVAVHIKMVVVGWSEVVTMADTPAVAARLIDVPLANGSLSSLSPIIFSSVRFYHAILVGHHPIEPFTTVADASQFSE